MRFVFLFVTWSSNPVFCDNPEGWDGVGDGKEAQEGGDMHILLAD